MNFHVITLFPSSFENYLKESIIGKAFKKGIIKVFFYNPRKFLEKKEGYLQIDGRPYGGGPGMVLQALPIIKAIVFVLKKISKKKNKKIKVVILDAGGKQFKNEKAKEFSKYTDLILICGRYEGIDARVERIIKDLRLRVEKVSIGPYVLTGGELPAQVIIDCVSRQIPGVLHKEESLEEKRFGIGIPVYTRPEILIYGNKKYKVPKILLSGHHQKIKKWKEKFVKNKEN